MKWIPIVVGVIMLGIIGLTINDALTQTNRCLESIAENYPNVSCGSSNKLYCVWNNNTYDVVAYSFEGNYWCDLRVRP